MAGAMVVTCGSFISLTGTVGGSATLCGLTSVKFFFIYLLEGITCTGRRFFKCHIMEFHKKDMFVLALIKYYYKTGFIFKHCI